MEAVKNSWEVTTTFKVLLTCCLFKTIKIGLMKYLDNVLILSNYYNGQLSSSSQKNIKVCHTIVLCK